MGGWGVLEWGLECNNTCRKGVTHRYVVRGLRLAGTDDSPSSEQSTMIKIPSCSHWHGVGQDGAADTCPSRLRPYPQTCPAVQRSRSSGSMSDTCPSSRGSLVFVSRSLCLGFLSFCLLLSVLYTLSTLQICPKLLFYPFISPGCL